MGKPSNAYSSGVFVTSSTSLHSGATRETMRSMTVLPSSNRSSALFVPIREDLPPASNTHEVGAPSSGSGRGIIPRASKEGTLAFYSSPGRGGRDSIDIDFERLFGRGGGGEPPITFATPSWIGKIFSFGLALVVVLVLLGIGDGIYTTYLWFQSLGLASVYVTRITAQIYTFLGFGAAFLIFLSVNVFIARRMRKQPTVVALDAPAAPQVPPIVVRLLWGLAITVQTLIMASSGAGFWEPLLKFKNATSFGVTDPLLNRDVSFYVFRLPVYQQLQGWIFWALLLTLIN